MALIGTIRKNGWILIVLLALALGGFILMDIMQNRSNYSMADLNTVGKVNGETITRDQFDRYEELIYGNAQGDPYQRRTSIWNFFVENALVNQEAAPLGLGVGKEELIDLQFGANPSPILAQRQMTPEILQRVKQMIETNSFPTEDGGRARAYWAEQEKEIIKERMQSKLIGMISKGIYAPAWQAEMAFRENNERLDFTYVRVPYDKIPDEEAKPTDADFAAYLKENSKMYLQTEETRIVDYVTVDVVPTAQDSADAKATVAKLLDGFRTAPNDSAYIALNAGFYDGIYKKKSELPLAVADDLTKLPVGTVVGPYLEAENWSIAKIIDRKAVADSVKARHILQKGANADQLIDSLKNLVETGKARFDSLAARFGTDGTAATGGDLGYFAQGQMVAEFNDLCFNKAEQGKLYKVVTQFGVHLVEVTGKKFINNEQGVRFGVISQRCIPGAMTVQNAKDRAIVLTTQAKTGADLEKIAGQQGLKMETSTPVRANDYAFGQLGQGNTAREIIRWAFDEKTKKGAVNKEYFTFADNLGYYDAKYVIASLKTISPKGEPTVDGVRAQIENLVKYRKKAGIIMGKLTNAGDLGAVAGQFGVQIDSAKNTSVMSPGLPTGSEPKVVGAAFGMKPGEVSKPIEGNTGVYIVKATSERPQATLPPDMSMFRRQATSTAVGQVRARLLNSLKKASQTDDFRSRFF